MLRRYEPYNKHIELCKIGNYQDYITKNTGANIFIPTMTNNGASLSQASCTAKMVDDEYILNATGSDMYIGGAYTYKLKMDAEYYKKYWDSESLLLEDFSKNRVAHLSDKLLDTCRLLRIFEENTSLSKYYYYLNLNKRLSIKFNGSIYLYDTTK